jgi:O-antigen/teichoic acid export membrane protein/glycosyltransferase involved in cell wall biosynthesis
MDDHKQRGRRLIAKNSILNLAGQVLPMLTGVLTIPYIVRGLGTDGYGILSIAMMLLGYFNIFDLGLSRATVKFVAENLDSEETHKVPELIWTSLSLLVILGCVGGVLAAFFVPVSVTHVFKMPPAMAGQARIALFVLCASMPIMLGNNALRGVLEAAQRFDLVNLVKVPSSVLFYLVAALAIPFGVHVAGIVSLMVGIRFVSTIAYFLLCFRVIPGLGDHLRFSRGSLRPLAIFGGWIMISNVANPIFGYLERFMIASILSVGTLSFYSAPYELVSKLLIFPMAVVPSLFPYFSYHGSKKSREVSEITSRTVKYLLLVFVPAIAIFCFFAHDIMLLWLGPTFAAQSTAVLQIITLVCVFNGLAYVPYTSVQALGRPDWKAIQDLITLPLYTVFAWWLMSRYGINGAAFAKLLLTLIDCFLLYTFASRLKAFSFRDLVSGPLFRAILASAGLLAAVFLIHSSHVKLPIAAALTVFSFVLYAVAFWMVAVDEEDRIIISSLREKILAMVPNRRMASSSQLTGERFDGPKASNSIDSTPVLQVPMRITFLLPGYPWYPSGGFRVVYEYANRLVERGHQVTVVHPRQLKFLPPAQHTFRNRLRGMKLGLKELFSIPSLGWQRIDKRVKLLFVPSTEERYIPESDALFATSWQTLPSVMQFQQVKGEKFYLIQGYETWMGPKDAVDQTWLSRTHKIVVSRWLLELGSSLGAGNLNYIPNAVDHSQYRILRPLTERRRQVVMPISWVSIKGSADGVKALEIAKMNFPDLRVVLFGNSRRPPWIPGWMTYAENPDQQRIVEDFYNASSIILSPGLTEGFPLPPAEGAACGCAIIATDIGGHREYVEHGVTGLLSPPGDPQALANNLCLLLGDDELRIRLAMAANERIKIFTWERSTALLEEFIANTVTGKPAKLHFPSAATERSLATPLQVEGD